MSCSPSSTPRNRLSPLPFVDLGLPRNSSPLNPNSTPTEKPLPLPPSRDDLSAPSQSPHFRERKISAVSDTGGAVTQSTADVDLSTLSLPITFDVEGLRSTFRERSRSPGRSGDLTQGPEAILSSSWWSEKHFSRPWHDSPKRKHTVPKEQTEAFDHTRTKVAQAVSSALGVASNILYETLFIGVNLIDLAPLPGLALAAKTLLSIWDAAQQIDMYRLACLRLTERSADMLISIRYEVHEAGDVVAEELAAPIMRLEESYLSIHRFMLKQIRRPWLKRYLNRTAIVQDIADCGADLHDALSLFNVSIQTRILKAVREAERQQHIELQALASSILRDRQPSSNPNTSLLLSNETQVQTAEPISDVTSTEMVLKFATSNALGLMGDSDELGIVPPNETSEIIPQLRTIHEEQNSLDTVHDLSDLRQIMRAALQTGSDVEMLEVLQIKRQEMPDAIKALQRELERLAELDGGTDQPIGQGVVISKVLKRVSLEDTESRGRPKRSTTIISIESGSSSGENTTESSSKVKRRDTLDQEFIENGIDALWRMSRGFERVPNWTITQFEIDRDEKIGIGFFSDVYKGRWRGRTVAIKVLAESTPRKLFVREVGIWKNLRHSNVLPLYGASSTAGDPPWFLVSPYLKNGSLVEHLKRVEHESRPPGLGIGSITNPVSPSPLSPLLSRSPGFRAISLPAFPDPNKGHNTGDFRDPVKPQSGENNNVRRQWDLFRFMHEISKGMEYLHGKGVLHGDLKAANVLVDDKYRCLISDFGQSEMKSEVYRISGTMPPHGTLRWQSPELMAGKIEMAAADDVWAFSICCVEILSMGRMPWPLMDDSAVRHFVLQNNTRPPTPRNSRFNTPGLQDILRACWNTKPDDRPPFSRITRDIKLLRKGFGHDGFDSPMQALDFISGGSLTFANTSRQVARRYSLPLKAGHKIAYLFSEITQYEYMETVDAPKKWFQLHVDTVMQAYGLEHRIQREDLLLVVGALRVPNYGLFVSHSHPEGHVHLSVYSSQKVGQPWGTFTTDSDFDQDIGPHYDSDEREIPRLSASKVSNHGEPWTAVLLSRLRFKPDALEPTLKK